MKAKVSIQIDIIDPPEDVTPDEMAESIQEQLTGDFDNLSYGIDDLEIAIVDEEGRTVAEAGFRPSPRDGKEVMNR